MEASDPLECEGSSYFFHTLFNENPQLDTETHGKSLNFLILKKNLKNQFMR